MEKKTIWQCHNAACNAQYSEYVNGCPKCSTGEPGGSNKVSILDEYHPAYVKPYNSANMEKKYPIEYNTGVPEARIRAEQFFDEEFSKLIDIARRHEVSQEKETWIGCYMAGYMAATPQGAVWVKAFAGMPDGIYNIKVESKLNHVVMRGVGSVVGGEIVLITFLNKTTFGKEEAQADSNIVYYLDESPSKESDAVDPDELWDEFSTYIANDIDSCQEVAGTAIMTKESFKKLMSKLRQP